tara:strand:- start:43655 stop:44056 length:402 start_codon:yes stop_codon:yes gene_type:complete
MIIICECKSEFDIPDSELPKINTLVQCSLCGKEWYQDFKNNKIISEKKQINPSKIKNLNITNTNKPKGLINYIFVFVIFLLSIYGIMIMFEKEILNSFPKMESFYLSVEIMNEIISVNFTYLLEILSGVFKAN